MRPRVAWWAFAAVAAALALFGAAHWISAVLLDGPVTYGEGAVAHAAILARERVEYVPGARYGDLAPIFTAANYPPLYFRLAGIGDPFLTGRAISIVSTLFVAVAIAWRARPAGPLVAATIALAWLGAVPVLQWGAALKPDLLALAMTVAAVLVLERAHPSYAAAGVLLGIAALAKPTALLPAIAIFVLVARQDTRAAVRGMASAVAAALVIGVLTFSPDQSALVHVLNWNALPWRLELVAPLVLLALLVLAVPLATIAVTRPSRTVVTAYAAGATAILFLGGREGATINYFLDLSAALALAIAGRAPRLSGGTTYPLAAVAQLAVGVALLNPFGIIPGRAVTTGAWGDPGRIAQVRDLSGVLLVEDSGLLVANGREPIVDDLFLWSRVHATGRPFPEGEALLAAVRSTRFDAIVSEADLQRLDGAPGYEGQRWHPDLVAAVLDRYELSRHLEGAGNSPGLFVYVPRAR